MSSALQSRCPTRFPQPSFATATISSSALILPRPRRCGGVSAEVRRCVLLLQPGVRPTDDCRWAGVRRGFLRAVGDPAGREFDEIKQAYKKKALKYHPDVSPPNCTEQYTQHFIGLKKAYQSDPVTREIYDGHLTGGLHFNEHKKECTNANSWK